MTFPTVQSRTTGASGAVSTSHTVTLPTTVNSGDLLLVAFTCGGGSGTSITWDNTTAGAWTTVANNNQSTNVRGALFSKVASGAEASAALSITLGASVQAAWTIWRISGCQGSIEAVVSTGTSTPVNFSALTPSWGADDTLWLAVGHINSTPTVSTYSTSYSNATRSAATGTSRVLTESCERLLNAASETPSSWTLASTNAHLQHVVAVRPSTATSLSITSVTPSQIDSGESFTITGTGFGSIQGLSLVQIGGVTQTVTSWSDSTIVCTAVRGSQSMGSATLTIYKM